MPKAFRDVPMRFSLASNLLMLAGVLASGVGSAFWGYLGDRLQMRKPFMVMGLLGGLVGYVMMYAAGQHLNSYWLYLAGQIVNGLFSASDVLVQSYIQSVYTKDEQATPLGILLMIQVVGAAFGSLILLPFIRGRSEELFQSSWVGIGGSVIALVLVVHYVVEPRRVTIKAVKRMVRTGKMIGKPGTSGSGEGEEKAPSSAAMPRTLSLILWIALAGSMLDSAGDEGTRIALGTVMVNVWPQTADLFLQNMLTLALIGLFFIVIPFVEIGKATVGMGAVCSFGALATTVTQGVFLLHIETYATWLVVYHAGKVFGFMSTMCVWTHRTLHLDTTACREG